MSLRCGPSSRKTAIALTMSMILATTGRAAWIEDGVPVSQALEDQRAPVIVPAGPGGAIIVWWDQRGVDFGIYAQKLDAEGNRLWSPPDGVLVADFEFAFGDPMPAAVSDGLGGAYVIWADARDLGHVHEQLYAQRLGQDGSRLWAATGVSVAPSPGRQLYPVAISDFRFPTFPNLPGVIVTWHDATDATFSAYAQRLTPDGSRLWSNSGVRLSASNLPGFPSLAIATDGTATQIFAAGAIVAWCTDGLRDIGANWVSAGGGVQWGNNGVAVCTAAGEQVSPSIANMGPGRAIITWEDHRDSTQGYDIYAQMIDHGTAAWAANGVPVCNTPGPPVNLAQEPVIARAGAGAFVVWLDMRVPADPDLFLQILDLAGEPQLTENGIPLVDALGLQFAPAIIPDGAGGAFAAWTDRRNGIDDIYAQRLDGNGNALWLTNGVRVCGAPGPQGEVRTIWNGTSLLLAWEDRRSAVDEDIYAGRLTGMGTLAVAAPLALAASELGIRIVSPNPLAGSARIAVELARASRVSGEVIDPLGRRVRRFGGEELSAGVHELRWDGRDQSGALVPAGTYFLRIEAGNQSQALKVVRLP